MKPTLDNRPRPTGPPGPPDPESNRVDYKSMTVERLLSIAFAVRGDEVFRARLDELSTRFDISALMPAGADRSRIPWMVKNLLVDRFALLYHMEQRVLPSYTLRLGPKGTKLVDAQQGAGTEDEATADGARPKVQTGRDDFPLPPPWLKPGTTNFVHSGGLARLTVVRMSMAAFAKFLSEGVMDRPVSDLTGLAGEYSFELTFAPDPNTVSEGQRMLEEAMWTNAASERPTKRWRSHNFQRNRKPSGTSPGEGQGQCGRVGRGSG